MAVMKRALCLALALASCGGPSYREEILPRYAILTAFGPESPLYRNIEWLADRRFAQIRTFRPLPAELGMVRTWLREFDPTYVAVVLRPEDLDTNFHLAFLDLACRLDSDPFPDFAFGYFPASDAATLQQQLKNIQVVESKYQKRLLSFTAFEPGAPETADETTKVAWATELPVRRLAVKDGEFEFLRKSSDAVERAAFMTLTGKGWAEGIRGWPPGEIQRLKLDSTVIFSSIDYSGAVGTGFDIQGGLVRRWSVPPERSVVLNLVRGGAVAILAPLGKAAPGAEQFEWSDCLLADAPVGWAMKHGYDLAILQAGTSPQFAPLVEPKAPPAGFEVPLHLASTRVLYGDPMLKPYERPVVRPLQHVGTADAGKSPEGDSVRVSTWKVVAYDCLPFFRDPAGGQRIYLKVPLPRGTSRAKATLRQCRAKERDVPATLSAQALEEWRGDPYLHVLLKGAELAIEDLFFELSVSYR
jgi:hypothetical protein